MILITVFMVYEYIFLEKKKMESMKKFLLILPMSKVTPITCDSYIFPGGLKVLNMILWRTLVMKYCDKEDYHHLQQHITKIH